MRAKRRRRSLERRVWAEIARPLDITHEEVLADLDPGWVGWQPAAETPRHHHEAA